jgi:hypothetical protein
VLAGDEGLLIPADAVTEPAVYFPHPEWRFAYDADSDLAVANRKKLLDRAATDRTRMLGFPLSGRGLRRAQRDGLPLRPGRLNTQRVKSSQPLSARRARCRGGS